MPSILSRSRRFDSSRLHMMIAASRTIRTLSIGLLARLELGILGGHKEAAVIKTIRKSRRNRESLLSGNEAFTVYSLARSQRDLDGEMAEVGVYQGVSARLISLASGSRPLHLFDTFAGLPEPDGDEHSPDARGALRGPRSHPCSRSWRTDPTSPTTRACFQTRQGRARIAGSRSCIWMSI